MLLCMKNPRAISKNPLSLKVIFTDFACICEGAEQIPIQ